MSVDSVLAFLVDQPMLLLAVLLGAGSLVGNLKVGGVSLGAAAVLFVSIAVGAWSDAHGHTLAIPEVLGTLGLLLFTFSIGVMSGPGFFASLRNGLKPILATIGVLLLAGVVAVVVGRLLGLEPALVAGTFAGAVTSTPALAAAREASGSALPTIGYAVGYVFGVLGMLVAAHIALRGREHDADTPAPLVNASIRVETDAAPSVADLERRHGGRIRFTLARHGGSTAPMRTPAPDAVLRRHDLVLVVGPRDLVEQVVAELGHESTHRLDADRSALEIRRITVSNQQVAGHAVGDLKLMERFGATVARLRRGDVDMLATDALVLLPGDRVRVVAPRERMAAVSAFLGDSSRGFSDINPVALGLGLAAGILLGRVVWPLPGGGFSLGSAAGSLFVGLACGQIARIGPVLTTLPHAAAQGIGEFGLLIFLAQAGVKAGVLIGDAIASGLWLDVFVLGAAITTTVAVGVGVVMRRAFGMGSTRLAGVLAGAQTQPAVLAFVNGRTAHDARVAQGYALLFPAALIAKILIAQTLGGL